MYSGILRLYRLKINSSAVAMLSNMHLPFKKGDWSDSINVCITALSRDARILDKIFNVELIGTVIPWSFRRLHLGNKGNVRPIDSLQVHSPPIEILTELHQIMFNSFPKLSKELQWEAIRARILILPQLENRSLDFLD